jgi:hypothetical protein
MYYAGSVFDWLSSGWISMGNIFSHALQEAQNGLCFFGWISIRRYQADGLLNLLWGDIKRVSKKRRPIFVLPEPLA